MPEKFTELTMIMNDESGPHVVTRAPDNSVIWQGNREDFDLGCMLLHS